MKKEQKKEVRRIRNLMMIFAITTIIITLSTYAWFIGSAIVSVTSFDIDIASTDSLLLSLDGSKWDTTIHISESDYKTSGYIGNSNTWGGSGLIPMSTVGKMDASVSKMVLYEKASLTASPGGYRLLASRAEEPQVPEANGFVAFDLFIKNFSGRYYINNLNILDEEAIYLTKDSAATVSSSGVSNTGIENSVRIAFAQIGRVIASTTDPDIITEIGCNDDGFGNPSVSAGVTGICRTAQIWEPNDTSHNENAIKWYNTSCLARTGTNVMSSSSFSGACSPVVDGTAYKTYAANAVIKSSDNADVYDGADYNGYLSTAKLSAPAYFTDTMKNKTGIDRPEIFYLAPNSITKVRVYIYIEGQDIDNYEYAAIGKRLSIEFGLTKERFTEDDIEYEQGLSLLGDTFKPEITMLGSSTVNVALGTQYVDAGATATDKLGDDGDGNDVIENLTRKIQTINPVNTNVAGTYYVTYSVSDWAGNYAEQVVRKVIVG